MTQLPAPLVANPLLHSGLTTVSDNRSLSRPRLRQLTFVRIVAWQLRRASAFGGPEALGPGA